MIEFLKLRYSLLFVKNLIGGLIILLNDLKMVQRSQREYLPVESVGERQTQFQCCPLSGLQRIVGSTVKLLRLPTSH